MTAARAIWSQTLAPGKTELKRIDCDIRISLATLDEKLVNQERSSVKIIQHEIEEEDADDTTAFVLANFIPGKIEAQTVDLVISDGESIEIEITGKNTVHLSGNYIVQPDEFPDYDSESESDEAAFHLADVSSDVEVNPDELMEEDEEDKEDKGRFEEIVEEKEKEAPKASTKRPAEVKPQGEGSSQKKQKKSGDKKPAAKPATDAKKQEKPASNADGANAKPAGAPPEGQGKKHKKNKNKDKKNV